MAERQARMLREWYEERAAIREYDGGYDRMEAERLAAEEAEQSFEAWRRLPRLLWERAVKTRGRRDAKG